MLPRLTKSGISILKEIQGAPAPRRLVVNKLWPAGGAFRMHIPVLLESDGLLEMSQENEVLSLTAEGRSALERKTWACAYCTEEFFGVSASRKLIELGCKSCGQDHIICKGCRKFMVVVAGDFLCYKVLLRECPSAKVRMTLLLKRAKPEKKKKGDEESSSAGNLL